MFIRVLLVCTFALVNANAALPQNFSALECAVARFAQSFAASKLPTSAAADVHDALNVDYLCANFSGVDFTGARVGASIARAAQTHRAARAVATHVNAGSVATFFVAPTGSDAAAGTQAAPFATLQRAAVAARGVSPRAPGDVTVFIRGGTFYLASTLLLTEADSNVTWSSYPGDAPVILSGAVLLPPLTWRPDASPGAAPGTLVANVPGLPHDTRLAAWRARGSGAVGPPPLLQSLFINGARQQRARYPNANVDDGTGPCFSATQRPGEGCAGWSTCALKDTGMQPAPAGVKVTAGPDRGKSPTWGCSQCDHFPTFKYTIYPPPPNHPVYNVPLPGVGWSNTSVFSFWGSPFSRPAGMVVDAVSCEGAHWARSYNNSGAGAVVHMFHSGLWGGWTFAVESIGPVPPPEAATPATPTPADPATVSALSAAMPQDAKLWLRADALPAAGDGKPLRAWPNSAAGGAHGALQDSSALQPTYTSSGWPGGLPAVRFSGAQYMSDDGGLVVPAEATLFAAVRDNGSTTSYCSGVVFVRGSERSVCTKATTAGPRPADDDPPAEGSHIIATALDWSGSPADPGHRDLRNKPAVLVATYSTDGTQADVNGCSELTDAAHSDDGKGYYIGSRNAEMGRFLVGDVGEVLIFARALNATERATVVAYLSAKWGVPTPKHCEAPPPPGAQTSIAFAYGGYQEARGSGINAGQHFYIENVKEELDAPGEWYLDADAALLFLLPNITASALAAATLSMPVLDTLVSVNGSQSASGAYATDIAFVNLTFTQSRITSLEMYEVSAFARGGGGGCCCNRFLSSRQLPVSFQMFVCNSRPSFSLLPPLLVGSVGGRLVCAPWRRCVCAGRRACAHRGLHVHSSGRQRAHVLKPRRGQCRH